MAKKAIPKTEEFNVDVCRTGYASRTFTVQASDAADAANKALDIAGNFRYSDYHADYEVGSITNKNLHSVPYDPPKKKRSVLLVFGTEAVRLLDHLEQTIGGVNRKKPVVVDPDLANDAALYEFDTESELVAFMQGIDAAEGWLDVRNVDDAGTKTLILEAKDKLAASSSTTNARKVAP